MQHYESISERAKRAQEYPNWEEKMLALFELAWEAGFMFEDLAAELSEQAHQIAVQMDSKYGKGYYLLQNAYKHYFVSDYEAALSSALQAKGLFEETGYEKANGKLYINLGKNYWDMGQRDIGLMYLMQSLEHAVSHNDRIQESMSINAIATCYYDLKDFKQALEWYLKYDHEMMATRFPFLQHRVLINTGCAYRELKEYGVALQYLFQGLQSAERMSHAVIEARAYNDIGNVYTDLMDYGKAEKYLKISIDIRKKISQQTGLITSLIDLGRLYMKFGHLENANNIVLEALLLAKSIKAKPKICRAYELLSAISEQQSDEHKALEYFKLYHQSKEEMNSLDTSTLISRIEKSYRVLKSQQEAEIYRLRNIELASANEQLNEVNMKLEEVLHANRNLLNNAGQGFFAFGESLRIEPEYSLECLRIFQRNIAGSTLSEIIAPDNLEEQRLIRQIVKKVFQEPELDRKQVYLSLLPQEVELRQHCFTLDYKLIESLQNRDEYFIMAIVTDVTEKRLLEKKIQQEQQVLKMVVEAVHHRNEIVRLLEELKDLEHNWLQDLDSNETLPDLLEEWFRLIHTYKGSFDQFYMNRTAARLHSIENLLAELKLAPDLRPEEVANWIRSIDWEDCAHEDTAILSAYLNDNFWLQGDTVTVGRQEIVELIQLLSTRLPEEKMMLIPAVQRWLNKPIRQLLSACDSYLVNLSARRGKRCYPLLIEGEEVPVDPVKVRPLLQSVTHLLRNAVDHGIEEQDERAMQGKDETATIRCTVERSEGMLRVTLGDDGRGIDPAVLPRIFEDGMSTAEEISMVSGRGVGLAAVYKLVKSLDGTITVESRLSAGTLFIMTFPYENLI